MTIWLKTSDLFALGLASTTLYRKRKAWQSRQSVPTGKGKPETEYLLESLPSEIQLKWAKLNAENLASAAGDSGIESQSDLTPSSDSRLNALQAALARFSPPQYMPDQRQAVETRCLELARLCDEAIKLIGDLKRSTGISVVSPGASEAGPGRKYHPD